MNSNAPSIPGETIRVLVMYLAKNDPSCLVPCHYLNKEWRRIILEVAPVPFPSWFKRVQDDEPLPHLPDDVVIRILESILQHGGSIDVPTSSTQTRHFVTFSLCRQWRAVATKYFEHYWNILKFDTSKSIDTWLDFAPNPYPYQVENARLLVTARVPEVISRLPKLRSITLHFDREDCKKTGYRGIFKMWNAFWVVLAVCETCESQCAPRPLYAPWR